MRRRRFLEIAGLSVAGACVPIAAALARGASTERAAGAMSGKRWALVIDEKKCLTRQGCQACVQACHRGHNVPTMANPRHEVKWVWKERLADVFPAQVTPYTPPEQRERPTVVLCNHCDNPPCVRVCPTGATWKRPDGIVMMDEHRCIGCRYCIAACPYGARSFNWVDPRPHLAAEQADYPTRTKGVVEKCTFCVQRTRNGQTTACTEACPVGARKFGDLNDPNSDVSVLLRTRRAFRLKEDLGSGPMIWYVG